MGRASFATLHIRRAGSSVVQRVVHSRLLPRFLVGSALLGSAPAWTQNAALEWGGLLPATSTLARGQTAVTNPIALNLPEWARRNVADASFISDNPALISMLQAFATRSSPAVVRTQATGGLFNTTDAWRLQHATAQALSSELVARGGEVQRSSLSVGARWMSPDLGNALFFSESRMARFDTDGSLDYRRHRDLSWQLATGGPIFDRADLGRLDVGMGVKLIARVGDEFRLSPEALAGADVALSDTALRKIALAGGIDYGLLYTVSKKLTGPWIVQGGLVWKDLGSTQFLGQATSTGRRFEALPNNQIFGVGLGLPNILDAFRMALRVEYFQWKRNVSWVQKTGVGFEARMPALVSFFSGLSGDRMSAGLTLRFPGFEMDLASVSELLGVGVDQHKVRNLTLELRSVF